jgi:hypothetical protein
MRPSPARLNERGTSKGKDLIFKKLLTSKKDDRGGVCKNRLDALKKLKVGMENSKISSYS